MGDRALWAVEMGRSGLDDQKMLRLQREEGVCEREKRPHPAKLPLNLPPRET